MYQFKTKPYQHQQQAFDVSWSAKYYALFMEMGTGKTKVAIDTIGALYVEKQLDAVLVLAPKGVFGNWVHKEIPNHLHEDYLEQTDILMWQPNHTKAYEKELQEKMKIWMK